MENNSSSQKKNLLDVLRAVDFALYDTILYLDAYPESKEALEYYHHLREERSALVFEYEKKFGPLTPYDNGSKSEWQWTAEPWPWKPEAN